MAFRLKPGKKLNRSLRDAAAGQLDDAIRQLLIAGPDHPEGVHDVRKHLKKLRAMLRLLRPGLGDRYPAQNAALRDAARLLSAGRDDEVLLQTFERLTASLAPEAQAGFAPVRARLEARRAAALNVPARDRLRALIALVRMRPAVRRWPAADREALFRGWKRGFKRARKSWREAEQDGGSLQVHEWRKRIKVHWYQTRLLQPYARERLGRRREKLRRLAEMLGEFHDLAVLREQLALDPGGFGAPEQTAFLDGQAAAEQARLLEQALPLGRDLFDGKPESLKELV